MQIFFSCYPTQKKDCANDIFQIINTMIPVDWERGWGRRIEGWNRLYDSLFSQVWKEERDREREKGRKRGKGNIWGREEEHGLGQK